MSSDYKNAKIVKYFLTFLSIFKVSLYYSVVVFFFNFYVAKYEVFNINSIGSSTTVSRAVSFALTTSASSLNQDSARARFEQIFKKFRSVNREIWD